MTAAPVEQRTERPPGLLYVLGIIFGGLGLLIPLLGLVGVALGLVLRSQGWRREGTIIAAGSAAALVIGAVAWYLLAYR